MARGRRPTEEVRREVLEAAGNLLLEQGMERFTIERVATLSGASKMTIYKLWPSKGALALEGYFASVKPVLSFPDTGDIETDLRNQVLAFVRLLRDTQAGRVIAGLIAQAQSDADLRKAFLRTYSGPRRELAVEALGRARDRGQLRGDLDLESVIDQIWGACYHRLLLPNQPLNEKFAEDLLSNLFRGIAT